MLHIQIPALTGDPKHAADWVVQFVDALPEELRTSMLASRGPAAEVAGSPPADLDVAGQLKRLREYWPEFSPRLTRLHAGLVDLGYRPTVPEQRASKRLASYIRYVDPVDGRGLCGTNSGTVTFTRKELIEELSGEPEVKIGRYPTVHFDTEAKVDLILKVAAKHKK